MFLDRRTKFNSLIVRSLCTYEGQSLLKIGKSRNEISKAFLPIPQKNATEGRLLRSSQLSLADVKTNVLGMLQDDVLQKHMKKNFIQSSKQRGISRKRKGNCGVVARWLMVLGGQTATCAFALANNNAARALNDVRPSVDVAVAVPSFIISPFLPLPSYFYPRHPSLHPSCSPSECQYTDRRTGHRPPTNALPHSLTHVCTLHRVTRVEDD